MNTAPEIKSIDVAMLTGLVQLALNNPAAVIRTWHCTPVSYIKTEESNLGLYRFAGTAGGPPETQSWSLLLKAVHAPVNETNPAYWNYHRREILAYQSGLLASLPGGLRAPRCFGVSEYADGICWLWLEDAQPPAAGAWSLADYGLAARHLGRFNGAYLTGEPLPVWPWLSQNWLRGWLENYQDDIQRLLALAGDDSFWEQPLLRSVLPQSIAKDIVWLYERHETLFAALDKLPRTFCHLDAYRPNLFIHHSGPNTEQTLAIDWVFAGPGGCGEEIANLLMASLIWFEYDAGDAANLDTAIFEGYLSGLREAGWQGDARLPRLGYTAACAMRWGLVGLWWLDAIKNTDKQPEFEQQWNRPMPQLASQWGKTSTYAVGLAQEAMVLYGELF